MLFKNNNNPRMTYARFEIQLSFPLIQLEGYGFVVSRKDISY